MAQPGRTEDLQKRQPGRTEILRHNNATTPETVAQPGRTEDLQKRQPGGTENPQKRQNMAKNRKKAPSTEPGAHKEIHPM